MLWWCHTISYRRLRMSYMMSYDIITISYMTFKSASKNHISCHTILIHIIYDMQGAWPMSYDIHMMSSWCHVMSSWSPPLRKYECLGYMKMLWLAYYFKAFCTHTCHPQYLTSWAMSCMMSYDIIIVRLWHLGSLPNVINHFIRFWFTSPMTFRVLAQCHNRIHMISS